MKTICIMNLKGGVGKSVTAINLSAIFALLHGKRVLLIDADHQGNTSKFYRADQDAATLREVLLGEAEPHWPENIQHTGYAGLDILPANMGLAELDAAPGLADSGAVWRLRELLVCVAADDAYDFAVIDMPPAFSLSARAALAAADEVIVPIKLDAFSIDGMAELLRQIASMQKINPGLTLAGVLITMWRNVEVVNQAEKLLRDSRVPVFGTAIRRTDIVDESTFQQEPLHLYSPRSAASLDYRHLAEEYLGASERGRGNG
mgnify:FL=1